MSSLSDQLEMLRARVESTLNRPSVIVVSSALAEDGKGILTSGLCKSLVGANYKTLLISTESADAVEMAARAVTSLSEIVTLGLQQFTFRTLEEGQDILVINNDDVRRQALRDSVHQLYAACRSSYDYTIINTMPSLSNNLAVLLAAAADGVILTIQEGRRVNRADKELAALLQSEMTNFIGAVSISRALTLQDHRDSMRAPKLSGKPPDGTFDSNVKKHTKRQTI